MTSSKFSRRPRVQPTPAICKFVPPLPPKDIQIASLTLWLRLTQSHFPIGTQHVEQYILMHREPDPNEIRFRAIVTIQGTTYNLLFRQSKPPDTWLFTGRMERPPYYGQLPTIFNIKYRLGDTTTGWINGPVPAGDVELFGILLYV